MAEVRETPPAEDGARNWSLVGVSSTRKWYVGRRSKAVQQAEVKQRVKEGEVLKSALQV